MSIVDQRDQASRCVHPAGTSIRTGVTRAPSRAQPRRESWLRRRAQRRRLQQQDQRSAQLAELVAIAALLREAQRELTRGWVQNGWFSYQGSDGEPSLATARNLHRGAGRPILGTCLVGAIVHAGGGLGAAHTQPVQRALDLSWHALSGDQGTPVAWCPAPSVRLAHIRELTRWNDQSGRTAAEVAGLLAAAEGVAHAQRELLVVH